VIVYKDMSTENYTPQQEGMSIEYQFVEKTPENISELFELLAQYPDQFIPGIYEDLVQKDLEESDIFMATEDNKPIAVVLFNRSSGELGWLSVDKQSKHSKSEIVKKIFSNVTSGLERGTKVFFYVNTEDSFIGKRFKAARKLYKEMGFDLNNSPIIKDHYGKGAHVYKVEFRVP